MYGSGRFRWRSTQAPVRSPAHDFAASVNHIAAAQPSSCHWDSSLPRMARRTSRTAGWPVSSSFRLEPVTHRALRQPGASLYSRGTVEFQFPQALARGLGAPVVVHELRRGSVVFSGEPGELAPAGPGPWTTPGLP